MALHLVEGAVIAGRFALQQQLGKGGMGEVWLAKHRTLDVLCAVKFIYAEFAASPEARARFDLEAKAAAKLRSSHVVQILDYGEFEGTPYLAMEYLEGEDLHKRLSRVRILDPRATVSIITQVARALGRAHAEGLVHRDLKPANVFLCREDDREVVKVLDFGVAKRTDDVANLHTMTGALIGTPFYMSPEQAQGTKSVDQRADLWSLAVIAFRCLTGKLPFESEALGDLLVKIIVHPIPIPSQIAPVPTGFDAFWARATARDPAGRFHSAKELADALRLALGFSMANDFDMPSGGPGAAQALGGLRRTLPIEPGMIPAPPAYHTPSRPAETTPARASLPHWTPNTAVTPQMSSTPNPASNSGVPYTGSLVVAPPPPPARSHVGMIVAAAVIAILAAAGSLAVYLLDRPRVAPPAQAAPPAPSAVAEPRSAAPAERAAPSVDPSPSVEPAKSAGTASLPVPSPTASAQGAPKGKLPARPVSAGKPSFDPGI